MTPVFMKNYPAPPVDETEILRYAGWRGDAEGILPLLRECEDEASEVLRYSLCHTVVSTDSVVLPGENIKKHIENCPKAVIFAATVGIGIDRLIAKYGSLSPTKALLMQSLGAERIEALCDVFCAEVKADAGADGFGVRSRFSPGYGDFPLDFQKNIITLLDTPKRIGLTLNKSLVLSPTKSVTAIIGLANNRKE